MRFFFNLYLKIKARNDTTGFKFENRNNLLFIFVFL